MAEKHSGRVAFLSLLFLCSGASALIFEVLWFRQAGFTFGNSVWASSIVLASFMAGLALGNAAAARWGEHVRRPLRLYAIAEATVGLSGLGLVFLLRELTAILAPVFAALDERPFAINAVRLSIAFGLLLVPTTAMGATLPLLARQASSWDPVFGRVLGRLYGWNTLGAVVGSITAEALLLEAFGIRGTAIFACGLNLLAATLAAGLSRRTGESRLPDAAATKTRRARFLPGEAPLLLASFAAGALFLALEVVWFRFLLLFVAGTSLAFAVMLAVALLGIALGSLAVAAWSRRAPDGHASPTALLLGAGLLVVLGYAVFSGTVSPGESSYRTGTLPFVSLVVPLMLPVALASGAVFTLIGVALNRLSGSETRSTGLLTLFNTLGGMLGSLAAGFALLPLLGVERSFLFIAGAYGVAAVVTLKADWRAWGRRGRAIAGLAGAAFLVVLSLFPSGLMSGYYLPLVLGRYGLGRDAHLAEWHEGVTETISYLRYDVLGQPLYHRLVTNGHSMSSSAVRDQRYMRLFVYLPVALRPEPKSALLISYGVGSTAKALTGTESLRRIDIVDISRDILEMSRVPFPRESENPTKDPRVRLHVEDGRFFLQTTPIRYDLITGEPPPPKLAGIVNLYTREYFALIRDRLAEGGVVSYWLPVHNLRTMDALAVTRAFCDVFPECSLWNGTQLDWVLLGSRGPLPRVDEATFSRQWRDERVAPSLEAIGFERPELVGATFLADAPLLQALTRGVQPLVDDFPKRLSTEVAAREDSEPFDLYRVASRAGRRFAASAFRREVWPETLGDRTLRAFYDQQGIENALNRSWPSDGLFFSDLDAILTRTTLRNPVLWMLGTEAGAVRIAHRLSNRGDSSSGVQDILAAESVSQREWRAAERRYASVRPRTDFRDALRVALLCLDGDFSTAAALAADLRSHAKEKPDASFWAWCEKRFGLRFGPADGS